jgi:hypothetical protein
MTMNDPVIEMQMVLGMVQRSVLALEEAQRSLEIQHRDLTRQAEWIKDEIRKAKGEPDPNALPGRDCPACSRGHLVPEFPGTPWLKCDHCGGRIHN